MAITSMDELVTAMPGQRLNWIKTSKTTAAAGIYSFYTQGGKPGAGSAPGSVNGAIPTDADTGFPSFTNAGGGNQLYLSRASIASGVAGNWFLVDRLWHNSGLVGNINTLQSFTMPSLTRYTTGDDVELWMQVYTAIGATPTTLTATYTNQAGTGSRTATLTTIASQAASRMVPFTLQAGDTGVRSVQSCQLTASTGTAGDFGLVLLRRLVDLPIILANIGAAYDAFQAGLPEVEDDAALDWIYMATTTSSGFTFATAQLVEG